MSERKIYLDPPPHDWRTRKISVRPGPWFATVQLDRDGYIESRRNTDPVPLSDAFVAAADRLREACIDRIWLGGFAGGFHYGSGDSFVTIFIDFKLVHDCVEALRAAEIDLDTTKLDALTATLALPIDDWLSPGERELIRGIDFDARPTVFLRFLRHKARMQGLRLNGRATAGGVWIRPHLAQDERLQRRADPDQYIDRPDRWTGANTADGLLRPYQGTRSRGGSVGATPVKFVRSGIPVAAECPCDGRNSWTSNSEEHAKHHLKWSIGVPIPKNVAWVRGDIARVTTQSSMAWRKLTNTLARLPQRENGYDFTTWSVGDRPKPSEDNKRAFLFRANGHAVGYLCLSDVDNHRYWDLDDDSEYTGKDTSVRACIDLIWIAATYRRKGLAAALVKAAADDVGCAVGDLSWSTPVSTPGTQLARHLSPGGVWVS